MTLVLLTGCSGFIAKHVALKLLNAGFDVRGTVRRLDRGEEVRAAVAPHLAPGAGTLSLLAISPFGVSIHKVFTLAT